MPRKPAKRKPGRPKGSPNKRLALKAQMDLAFTEKVESDIWNIIAEQCLKGDPAAIKLWLEYRHGRPMQNVNIAGKVEVTAVRMLYDPKGKLEQSVIEALPAPEEDE